MAINRKWQNIFSAVYPAFLFTLLVTKNIEGDGDYREDNANSKLQKTASFIKVEPLNVHQSTQTYILLAALIFSKRSRG
jgi:hypothetical protein